METFSISQVSWGVIASILSAGFLSALISGIGGFGGSFILAGALIPIIGPKGALPLIAVYAFFSNLGRIYFFRKSIHWGFAIWFTAASLPGLWLGALFLITMPDTYLLIFFGIFLMSALPIRRWLKRIKFSPNWLVLSSIGFVFGLYSGTAVGSGMFVISALNTIGLHGTHLLGTDATIGIINAASRVFVFAKVGILDWTLFVAGLLLGIVSIPATWMASLIVKRMGNKLHASVIEAIIFCAGLYFMISGFYSLSG